MKTQYGKEVNYSQIEIQVQQITAKYQQDFFVGLEIRKGKGVMTVKTMKNKNKGGRNQSDYRAYYIAIIKTVWFWQRDKDTDQRNRIENPEITQV